MKATGIVRRIDDLGRVVIPKEIRRTMRIREGDPLEIYTDKEGGVIFKKYSLMGGLGDFSSELCDTLHKTTGRVVTICDRDTCVAVAGAARKQLFEKRISARLEQLLEARALYQHVAGNPPILISDDNESQCIETAMPVLSGGDVLGCVLFSAEKTELHADELQAKLAQTIAGFLGKHMES